MAPPPDRPPGVSQELWDEMVLFQEDETEFRERKKRFLSSLETGHDKIMDRALDQLRAEELELRDRAEALSRKMRERFNLEL